MSLLTDKIFVQALRSNSTLISLLPDGDVHNTSIAMPDEDLLNAPLPYVIVSYDGMTNDASTKDDYEGDDDTVTIGIEVAAVTRPELGDIMEMIRTTVKNYFLDAIEGTTPNFSLIPLDYQLSAGQVVYDPLKPCYAQRLTYQCDTNI